MAKRIAIEDSFDLHPFHPKDLASVLDEYLGEAAQRGWREVRIIHGKGRGVARARVRRLLAAHALVAGYADAPPERGAFGATIVQLKPGLGR